MHAHLIFAHPNLNSLNGQLRIATITGAPEETWVPEKRGTVRDIFKHLFVETFDLCGMEPLEPFIVHGVRRLSDAHRQAALSRLSTYLMQLHG